MDLREYCDPTIIAKQVSALQAASAKVDSPQQVAIADYKATPELAWQKFYLATLKIIEQALREKKIAGFNIVTGLNGDVAAIVDQSFAQKNQEFVNKHLEARQESRAQLLPWIERLKNGPLAHYYEGDKDAMLPVVYMLLDNIDLQRTAKLFGVTADEIRACLNLRPYWKNDPLRCLDSTIDQLLGPEHNHSEVQKVAVLASEVEQKEELLRSTKHEIAHGYSHPLPEIYDEAFAVLFSEDPNTESFRSKVKKMPKSIGELLTSTDTQVHYYGRTVLLSFIGEAIYLFEHNLQALPTQPDRLSLQREGVIRYMERMEQGDTVDGHRAELQEYVDRYVRKRLESL